MWPETQRRFEKNLNLEQFGHSVASYQPPLPGLEHLGDKELPTNAIFKRPVADYDDSTDAWSTYDGIAAGYQPHNKKVRIGDLTPTEPTLNEPYLYKESRSEGNPVVYRHKGKNLLVDGHHRTARARLDGAKTIDVDYYDTKRIFGDG